MVTKKQIAEFRSVMEETMRKMVDKQGKPCITEEEIKEHCYDATDDYIKSLIENGTKPEIWADMVTSY